MRVNLTRLIMLIMFAIFPLGAYAQTGTVSGTVTDENGDPMLGVTIIEDGTNNGVITDASGSYRITLRDGGALVFSFVGYDTQSIEAGNRTTLDVVLRQSVNTMEGLVVVGYGTQRRSDVTGAIASIGEDVLTEVPSANIAQALQGRVAGITISQNSTRPGQAGQIRIRGTRSLNASNDPLIVLDGIPFDGSMNDINPYDVASIDILKDASATAIYGSRGANGVILITSTRGTSDQLRVSYNGSYGIKAVARKYDVFNGQEYAALRDYIQIGDKNGFTNSPEEDANLAAGRSTDWQKEIYDTGYVTQHDIGIQGGTGKGYYSAGAGLYKETTVMPGQDFNRFSLRASFDQEIGRYFKVGLSTNNSYGVTNGESASFMYQIITASPLMSPYNEDGSINQNPWPHDDYFNPLLVTDNSKWAERRKRFSSFNSLYGEIKFTDWLKYRVNVGLSYIQDNYGSYYGQNTPFRGTSVSQATVSNALSTAYTVENLLYFNKTWNNTHRLDGTLMFSAQENEYNKSYMQAYDLNADYGLYYNLGNYDANGGSISIPADQQDHYKKALLSYMARVNYGYDNRYIATVTFRRDGSSVLAPGNKWHNYPAASVAWNVTNEEFMKGVRGVDLIKIRAGFGQTANESISPYSTLGSVQQSKYNFGTNYQYAYYQNTLRNPDLKWEYTNTWNLGLDFHFLESRLTGSVEFYTQHTYNLLMNQSLPSTAGIPGSVMVNAGETTNKGFEVSVSGDILKGRAFEWSMDANIYLNRNKIVKLSGDVDRDESNGWFVGQPIDVIYDYKKIGIWQLHEAAEATTYGSFNPGDVKIEDNNWSGDGVPDGTIDPNDRTIVGQLSPKFEGGFTSRMYYKNFDLTIVGFYRVGGKLISTIHTGGGYTNMLQGRRNQIKVNYWTEDNPTNDFPRPANNDQPTSDGLYGGTLGYFDGGFLKIRSITLGYNLPRKWTDAIGLRSARVYFTAQNPFVFFSEYVNKYGGVDPEATGTGAQSQGSTYGIQNRALTIGLNTPPTRNFIFGLNINF